MSDICNKNDFLHQAVRQNNTEVIVNILRNGTYVNCKDKNSCTPLHIAAENGAVKIAEILLTYQADIFAKDKYGRTVLDTAFWNGDENLIKSLLSTTKDVNISTNNREDTPLHLATELCSPQMVQWLLNRGAQVNAQKYRGKTPLHVVALRGIEEIARLLIKHDADVNFRDEDGDTPLLIASRNGKEGVVNALLEQSVIQVNLKVRKGETALHLLIENKASEKTIRALLTRGALVNTGSIINRTPLHITAIYGKPEIAETLLEFEADPNLQDSNGQTPLHLACTQGNEGVVKVLLQHGAVYVDEVNQLGKTALHYAAAYGNASVVNLLLKEGADPNARNRDGRTPLAYSVCETFSSEVIELLLKFGANINSLDMYGLTPLHIAGRTAVKEMVSLLLDLGADINAVDWDGRTTLEVAKSFCKDNRGTIITLENNIIMRETAGLYVCEENLALIENDDEEIDFFRSICRQELDNMKKIKIGASNVSYHDVFTKSVYELVKIARNEDVQKGIEATDKYVAKFPLYGTMMVPVITKNFEDAAKRRNLLEQSLEFFSTVFSNFPKLPKHCMNRIFGYLTNQDLKNWIHAFENK